MQRTGRILLIGGRDVSMTSAIANLLTLAGYSTDSVLDRDSAIRTLRHKRYDLAVVCDSFDNREQLVLRAECRRYAGDLRVLLLALRHREPDVLLNVVGKALALRAPGAAASPVDETRSWNLLSSEGAHGFQTSFRGRV